MAELRMSVPLMPPPLRLSLRMSALRMELFLIWLVPTEFLETA
jgi:hypothetical protein